jgi:hypothetical protein
MDKQELKKAFFLDNQKIFSKKNKNYLNPNLRAITTVFTSIASNSNYKEIRKRYKIDKILSKILLSKHMYYVLYSFYRNSKLTIAVPNHIGQNELNLQKMNLIKYLKQIDDYKNINSVSIFRDEKFLILKDKTKKQVSKKKDIIFNEKSYGIFENEITDKKLYKIIEHLRIAIKSISKNY